MKTKEYLSGFEHGKKFKLIINSNNNGLGLTIIPPRLVANDSCDFACGYYDGWYSVKDNDFIIS